MIRSPIPNRGGAYDVMDGQARDRNVVIEFKDRATARACL
ncbi:MULTISPECIES: DUF1330 domain-containing protein [unclassified Bradyrhizobium]|nr:MULTISPECIES: DUF1330 domain-containing protein [unclassified Bradyrhizobium]MCK1710264.1 DUF1330 domain-containing protein [Bradyrhizobium sp. 143]MCK1731996.1 DUF1330 domain-containing protein [Bradyrhizobium sp. 142]